jgi:hypothetical protein
LACATEVAGYYIATPLRGFPVASNEIAFWAACAVVGGPLFGWAGWAWQRGSGRDGAMGAALLPATFIAEGIGAYAIRLHYIGDAVLFGGLGLLLLIGVCRLAHRTWAILVWTVASVVVGAVLYGPVLDAVSRFAFGA